MAAVERHLVALGAAHLGGARTTAASGATLQVVARPGVCHQIARRGRALFDPPAHSLVLSVDEKSEIQRRYGASGEEKAPSSL